MKIIVIGATGTIGAAVAAALAVHHEVIRASRSGVTRVNVEDAASVDALFASVKDVDAVVSCATGTPARWGALFGPIDEVGEAKLTSIFDFLGAQIRFLLACRRHVRDGGSITLTTGALARKPRPGSAVVTMMAAGLEGFVRSAALEMPRGVRMNAVSPGAVQETMDKLGNGLPGMPAHVLAEHYVAVVEGTMTGEIVQP